MLVGVFAFSLVYIPTANASELCEDINDELSSFFQMSCDSNDVVSFIDFEGGLNAPGAEGLDPTLTRSRNARELILNVINFVLGFLGIVAVAIVIYGGILYVTAAGSEEQAGKAKKSITYSVIGIFIIIGSFALINTLLSFGGGSSSDRQGTGGDSRSIGQEGSNITQQAIYNFGAAEINSALNDFVAAYRNFTAVKGIINRLNNVAPPLTRSENRQYISQVSNLVNEIKNNSNALSETRQVAQRMLDEYLFRFQSITDEDLTRTYDIEGGGISTDSDDSDLQHEVNNLLNGPRARYNFVAAAINDYNNSINDLIGSSTTPLTDPPTNDETTRGRLRTAWKILGAVAEAPASTAIERNITTERDLQKAFAGIDPNITVRELFVQAITKLHEARSLANESGLENVGELSGRTNPNPDDGRSSRVSLRPLVDASTALYRLYLVVKNIKFVYVKIAANVTTGHAPLVVELNGLQSRDPIGMTIPEANYKWDPDGDGLPGVSRTGGITNVECDTDTGPTIACIYYAPGTYLVKLDIESQDPSRIAKGRAVLAVTIQPSVARISLRSTVGAITQELRRYEQSESAQWEMTSDNNELQLTTEEARNTGVNYDASDSRGGSGEEIQNFKWTFGGSIQLQEGPDKNSINNLRYPGEGRYPLVLEVTDRGGRTDRKIVNVVVGSIASRISARRILAEPEEVLEFDGSLSRTDRGSITSYTWNIFNGENEDVLNNPADATVVGSPSGQVLRVKFKKPGTYSVQLTVSDGSRTGQSKIENVAIKSRKPRANFTYRACPEACPNPNEPSVVELDASSSFDPDSADTLTYDWQFFNEIGEELRHPTGITILDNAQFPSQQVRRFRIKFNNTGRYKAVLRVNDSHGGTIQQEDFKEREIGISSVVEVNWDQFDTVRRLENGEAGINLTGNVRNANRVQIDFGDGETNEQTLGQNAAAGSAANSFAFQHDYTRVGSFVATLNAISEEGKGETTILKRIYVGAGEDPLAVIDASVDNRGIVLPEETSGTPAAYNIIRNKPIRFDAGKSINSSGQHTGLRYSWDFGDNARSTGATVQHSFENTSPDNSPYVVTLTVTEESDSDKSNQTVFPVSVISSKPRLNTLSLEKKTQGETTPIDVELTAEGAVDPDGRITNYQFWYFDPADSETKLSVIDTQSNRALLTVETSGEANEEREYLFCVSMTDNDNTTSDCSELMAENQLPRLQVKNGPNQPPRSAFTADRTGVRVNELVTLTSSSTDPDGRIAQYIWDLEGDGFQNDTPSDQSTVTHRYARRSPQSGYRVKLKVIDDKNAAGFSREIPIHVAAQSNSPRANFTYQVQTSPLRRVKFFDSSTADTANSARLTKWKWDFDTSQEFGCDSEPRAASCNGNKTDDSDSEDQNPVFDFPASGTFQVKLIVEDSDGNSSEPKTSLITLIPGSAGGTSGVSPVSNILNANLQTSPPFATELAGGEQRKTIHIPANADSQDVTFLFGNSTGDVTNYRIDKNIWCDADGDGNRTNDPDFVFPNPQNPTAPSTCTVASSGATSSNCWTVNYNRFSKTRGPGGPGKFRALLTVTDRNQNLDSENIDVIFDGVTDPARMQQDGCDYAESLYSGSLFKRLGMQKTILFSLIAGVIAVLFGFAAVSFFRKGKTRQF